MRKIEEHAETLVQATGALVKSLYGKYADFIVIPVLEVEDGMEMAIMSSMGKEKTAFVLVETAQQAICMTEDGQCDCPTCTLKRSVESKKFEGDVVDISEGNNIH